MDTTPRRGWRQRLETGIYRRHRLACPSSRDHRTGRRCDCPYEVAAPTGTGRTRWLTVAGSSGTHGRPALARRPRSAPSAHRGEGRDAALVRGSLAADALGRPASGDAGELQPLLPRSHRSAPRAPDARGAPPEPRAGVDRDAPRDRPQPPVGGVGHRHAQLDAERGRPGRSARRQRGQKRADAQARARTALQASANDRTVRARGGARRVAAQRDARAVDARSRATPRRSDRPLLAPDRSTRLPHHRLAQHLAGAWRLARRAPPEGRTHARRRHLSRARGGLADWLKESVIDAGADAHGLVWPGQGGRPLAASSVVRIVHGAQKRAGLLDADKKASVSPHGLRRTAGSTALGAGVPLLVVSRQLGHSDQIVTARHYAHLLTDEQLDAFAAAQGPGRSRPRF